MKLKNFLFAGIFLFISLIVPALAFAEEPVRTLRVGAYDNKPKIYKDENGKIEGIFADVVDYVAEEEGWNVEYIFGTWDECMARLGSGEIDVMIDVAVSPERRDLYDFNEETVLPSWASVYSREGLEVNNFQDFEGKKVAIMESGILFTSPLGIQSLLDSFSVNVEYVDVSVYSDVFKLLDEKKADIGIVNRFFGLANEGDYDVVRSSLIFDPSELRFAFPKDATDNDIVIEAFDSHLHELKKDPDSFYYKFIREKLSNYTVQVETKTPEWVTIVLSILAVVIVWSLSFLMLSKRYQRVLEKRVVERTADLKRSKKKYENLYNESLRKVEEMKILTNAAVDREMRIKELKEKIRNV